MYLLRKKSLESAFMTTRCLWKTGVGVAASAASGSSGEPSSGSSTLKRFSVTMAPVFPPETHIIKLTVDIIILVIQKEQFH